MGRATWYSLFRPVTNGSKEGEGGLAENVPIIIVVHGYLSLRCHVDLTRS